MTELNETTPGISGSIGRLGVIGAVGVTSAVVPSLAGKAAVRAATIRYSTKAIGCVAKGVIPSNTWRAAAVFTGTRVSNYLNSGWIPYLAVVLMVYDGYKVGKWLLSDQ